MNAVEFRDVHKSFGDIKAIDGVSFEIRDNDLHVLVGENGAGKSTLMNLLYGLYIPDSGEIRVRERSVKIKNPKSAIALGIGMVHQHFTLINRFDAIDNAVLGSEPRNILFFDKGRAEERIRDLSKRFGIEVKLHTRVEDLSVGEQQKIELLKVLYRDADTLIFDEPTAVLAPQEIESLYGILEELKRKGKTIIFITHKMREVMRISDRVTVMRAGKSVVTIDRKELDPTTLGELIIGRELKHHKNKGTGKGGRDVLTIKNLHATGARGDEALRGIEMKVLENEVMGLAGVEGNGQRELVEVLLGLKRAEGGKILFCGQDMEKKSVKEHLSAGIGYVPEDRKSRGMVGEFKVYEDLILGQQDRFSRFSFFDFNTIKKHSENLVKTYDVRPGNIEMKTKNLSGGNQQKIILARELSRAPQLLIAEQPSRGLDIGATEFVHEEILNQKKRGSVLLISSDLEEIRSLSDRICVIFEGKIIAEFTREEGDEKRIGRAMMGNVSD